MINYIQVMPYFYQVNFLIELLIGQNTLLSNINKFQNLY